MQPFSDDAIIHTAGPIRIVHRGVNVPKQHCRSGCRTKDHASYAQCLRDAGTRVAYCDTVNGSDATTQKRWDRELDAYRAVRKEGIQPEGTTMPKIMHAVRESDRVGAAYGRDFNVATPMEN